jgi:transcriptional regulator with XRE-family HTH domain
VTDEQIGRRVQIARIWFGYSDRDKFAPLVEARGMSAATLGRIERGDRPIKPMELDLLHDITKVPIAFFVDESVTSLNEAAAIQRIEQKIDGGLDLLAEALSVDTMKDIRDSLRGDDPPGEQSQSGEQQ